MRNLIVLLVLVAASLLLTSCVVDSAMLIEWAEQQRLHACSSGIVSGPACPDID